MGSRTIVLLLCLLLALAGAVDPKGSPKLPKAGEHSPKGPKEDKHPKEKHHKEKKDKHHKEHKDKHHPKEDKEASAEEAAAPATRSARAMATNTTDDAAVEEEAQKEACAPCCGVDLSDVTSKLPFINRK
jgi:hypothetical protein